MATPQPTADFSATHNIDAPSADPRRTVTRPPSAAGPTLSDPVVPTKPGEELADTRAYRDSFRLRLGAVLTIGAVASAANLLSGVVGFEPAFDPAVVGHGGVAALVTQVVVWGGLAVALWARRGWSIRGLRAGEGALLGLMAVVLVVLRVGYGLAYDPAVPGRGVDFLRATASNNGYGWMVIIMAWGLIIPNSWRRVVAVSSGFCLLFLLTEVGLAAFAPAGPAARFMPAISSGQMLLNAVALSLFGLYQLTALRVEAAEARREARDARQLGPYTLTRPLGSGGMGEVFLAEHHLLKRPCAIKFIRPERAGDPAALLRFEREARTTARLKHPNTVEVFDYGRTDDGTFYYVMEYLDGLSLEEVVRRHGPLPPGRVVRVLTQFCGALREAHRAGLVHRDIKPSNVFLCRHGGLFDVVKLLDFGLVSGGVRGADAAVTQAGAVMGTPDYMSPEQADGTGADERSDLYSLGATVYFLLTGRPPFTGRTALDVLVAHRTQPVPSVAVAAGAPAALDAVVMRLLAKSPADRPPTADAVLSDLATCDGCPTWSDADAERWWETTVNEAAKPPDGGRAEPGSMLSSGDS